jgi:hypothetical protein
MPNNPAQRIHFDWSQLGLSNKVKKKTQSMLLTPKEGKQKLQEWHTAHPSASLWMVDPRRDAIKPFPHNHFRALVWNIKDNLSPWYIGKLSKSLIHAFKNVGYEGYNVKVNLFDQGGTWATFTWTPILERTFGGHWRLDTRNAALYNQWHDLLKIRSNVVERYLY